MGVIFSIDSDFGVKHTFVPRDLELECVVFTFGEPLVMRRPREKLGQSARETHVHDGWGIAVGEHIVHTQRLVAILDRGHQGRDHAVMCRTPVSVEFILHLGGGKSFSEIDWELTLRIIVGKVWAKPPLSTWFDPETFR